MTWYRDGSINLTAGSNVVTGTGTTWLNLVLAGEGLDAPDGRVYEVAEVVNNGHLRLTSNYLGATAAGAAYQIIPNASMTKVLAKRVSDLLSNYELELPKAFRRENHTGGFNGFGALNVMTNSSALPASSPPSAFFSKGSYEGMADSSELGVPLSPPALGTVRCRGHWGDSTAGWAVSRSFITTDARQFHSYALNNTTWSTWVETTNRASLFGTQPLSTISDAGTAAARNVQTSPTDVTLGRLMPVGAFGAGRINPVGSMNLSNFGQYPSGRSTYYLNDAFNGPYPSFYGYLEVDKVDDSYVHQTIKAVETGLVYKRTVNNGNIQPWLRSIDTKTAVGEIASGSIIERGSNANGEYTKLADGTATAWGYRLGYVAGDNSTPLPLQFVGSCASSLSIIPSVGWQTPLGWYASPSNFFFSMPTASTGNAYIFFVKGRWK